MGLFKIGWKVNGSIAEKEMLTRSGPRVEGWPAWLSQARSRLFLAFLLATTSGALVITLPTCAAENRKSTRKVELKTAAFSAGGDIPRQFTCDGRDTSPALSWNDPPAATRGFALIMDDPDAPMGTFVHWVVYNLPSTLRGLPEGVPGSAEVPGGGQQGINDFPKTGYRGPCPPPGKPHRYFFKLYALDAAPLNLGAGARKEDVEREMRGHVLAEGSLMGRYGR